MNKKNNFSIIIIISVALALILLMLTFAAIRSHLYSTPTSKEKTDEKADNSGIVITIEWESHEPELDIGVELASDSYGEASWLYDRLYLSDGTLLATKYAAHQKQTVHISDPEKVYYITIDDLNYVEHITNHVSSAKLTVTHNGKVIVDSIGPFMLRAPTGYWYASFSLDNGIADVKYYTGG